MPQTDLVSLGITLVVGAAALIGLTLLLLRVIPRLQVFKSPPTNPAFSLDLPPVEQGVLLVQSGGRIVYINELAREWFEIGNEEPNIERMARRARPSDDFLSLCASDGKVRFSLFGHLVEGVSYSLPPLNGAQAAILVTLKLTPVLGSEEPGSGEVYEVIAELSSNMASSLDLDTTLQAILDSVDQLIPSDYLEVSIWDRDTQQAVPYHFTELGGKGRRLEKSKRRYQSGKGYPGFLIKNQQPLLVGNIDTYIETRPSEEDEQIPYRSYLGIPLLVAGTLIGTIELASLVEDSFGESELAVLRMLASQAAVALNNAQLFQDEQRRILELSSLAKLTQATTAIQDSQDFYAHLIDSLLPLFNVKTLGFLIYDDVHRKLKAQPPFHGLPEDFVAWYEVVIQPGSLAEEIWDSQNIIIAPQAAKDVRLEVLGIAHFALAASMQSTILVPLISAGRMLGYLQAADRIDGLPFSQDNIRLLTIVTGQVATIIENAILARQAQERVLRSEAMRRIASLAGSMATLNEILSFSLRELAHLLKADLAAIYLVNEELAELTVHKSSLYGISLEKLGRFGRMSMGEPSFRQTVTSHLHEFYTENITEETDIPAIYQPFIADLDLKSVMIAPLVVRERGVGEMILASRKVGFLERFDLSVVSTTASQLASAIEKATLYTQTDDSLRRRVEQLIALTRVSRELNTRLDLQPILELVQSELLHTTRANCGVIWLFEFSEQPQDRREIFMAVGDFQEKSLHPVESQFLSRHEALIIEDYSKPIPELGDNLFDPPHEGIVSSLLVPIIYQETVAGLIHLHSRQPGLFDSTSLDITQSLATQASIALGNALRFHEQIRRTELLSRRVETLSRLVEANKALFIDQPIDEALEAIAYAIQESTPFNTILISIYDPLQKVLNRSASAGLPLGMMEELRQQHPSWENVMQDCTDEFRCSQSYMIPYEHRRIDPVDLHLHVVETTIGWSSDMVMTDQTWHPQDLLLVPLYDRAGNPLGMISADNPRNGLRPDNQTIETLEVFASQAVLTIESHQKIKELSEKAEELTKDLDNSRLALANAQTNLPLLLHKDLEQTVAIQKLDERNQRLQAGLELVGIVNQNPNRLDVLLALGSELVTRYEMDLALIAERSPGGLRLVRLIGNTSRDDLNLEALLGQKNPLRTCLQNGRSIVGTNLEEDPEWSNAPLLQALEIKSFICLPIIIGELADSVVMIASNSPMEEDNPEDVLLYEAIAHQIAVKLLSLQLSQQTDQHMREVDLLLDFSQQIGRLDVHSILDSLVSSSLKVVPAAEAGMIALWDAVQECLVPRVATGYHDNELLLQITYRAGQALPGLVFQQAEPLLLDEVEFSRDYNLSPEHLLIYRDANEGRLPVSSMILPIRTTANNLGVMVLDNFRLSSAFTSEDLAMIGSLTRQTALMLENLQLYQAAEQRATQMLSLTNLAATITSSLQTNELIDSLLDQVRMIIPYDTGTLWLRQGNRLTVRAASGFDDSDQRIGLSVAIEDSALLEEMIATRGPISVANISEDDRFPSLVEYQRLSWLGVPLLSKGEVVGVIALEKAEANFYTASHIDLIITFAGQAAVALVNARLYEESVGRAVELDKRSQRLALLNRLSTELSSSLDQGEVLRVASRELKQAIHCTSLSTFLADANGRLFLYSESPERAADYPLEVPESPLFEWISDSRGIFLSSEIDQEVMLGSLLDFLKGRDTQSLMVLPLVTAEELIGLFMIHVDQSYHFADDELELARTISNQTSVALQNARLFAETEALFAETHRRSTELAALFELGVNVTQVLDLEKLVETAFENTMRMINTQSVGLVLLGEEDTLVLRATDRGEWIGPTYAPRRGSSFSEYVLLTSEPLIIYDVEREAPKLPVQGLTIGEPVKSWLGVPLIVRGSSVGVISVQSYEINAFNKEDLRLLLQVANQLAVAFDNARLFETAQSYASDLEKRVSERTHELATEHSRTQTLLGIITELSASLDLDTVLNRTLAIINQTIGAEHSLIMLLKMDQPELYLRVSLGYAASPSNEGVTKPLQQDESLASWVINHRQGALIPDLLEDPRWVQHKERTSDHRSSIAVPLMMGEENLGVMILYHRQPNSFTQDQFDLVQAIARQIAVAINNAQLYNLIRDQAERLGDMLRMQHVDASRSQAILEAVADGVLVTDDQGVITLFNVSAEQLLGLARDEMLGQSLDCFIGLFGKAGHTWVQTIENWSSDPTVYIPGESYSEQIELDNGRVISVHLSPVLLRNDFLGTVSIFRDITHLIEIDRLKSEFVATVSHELRTPMTSIKGYVEILLMGAAGALTEQQTQFLQVVRSNSERLAILVNDLLDISRIEAGKVILSMQPLDMYQVTKTTVANINRRLQSENRLMNIDIDIEPNLPEGYGDPERIQQIFDNLVENAYQYTPDNGNIWIRIHQTDGALQVDIQDNGIGIQPHDQPRIFERFFRGEDQLVLGTSGTGLGLSIVKHLVEMHHGKIWFISKGVAGEGSTFSFTLPIFISDEDGIDPNG